jgi:hypothetical protein
LVSLLLLLPQVAQTLQSNMIRRCVQHWKAWVDQRVDWRSFEAQIVQHMMRNRCASIHTNDAFTRPLMHAPSKQSLMQAPSNDPRSNVQLL